MKVEYSDDLKIAYFNGVRFTRDDQTGYYLSAHKVKETGKRIRLHKYVWLIERGEIPEGCQIHHVDEDKSHNDIDNLECLSEHDHLSYHSQRQSEENRKKWLAAGIDAAKTWHKSKAGRDWHKKHFENNREALFKERFFVCEQCGKPFTSPRAGSRFCSNNCRAAFRRASGVDDIRKICPICGKEFMTNKYASSKTCGTECKGRLIWKARRAV